MRKTNRFVVFADFLGTKQRYATPRLVVRSRELLEQALTQCVLPKLKDQDMNLYVYSDTAIVTCPSLAPLLQPVSDLFHDFIQKGGVGRDTELTLWLRAAISYGSAFEVDHLSNSDRVRTIPFLDTSLPTAYNLETIRKGSRVFVDPAIRERELGKHRGLFLRWKEITGHGHYAKNVGEYLWPAIAYPESTRLAKATKDLHAWWNRVLNSKEWSKDDYYVKLIHLDETVKLFIRTSCLFCSHDDKKELLTSLLPSKKGPHKNIPFQWGMWFQVLKGLAESSDGNLSETQDFVNAFKTVKRILTRRKYLEHFLGELNFPDYAGFRRSLSMLGLHQFLD